MGAVEDTRKIPQDFLAPELREIKVRLDVLEKQVEGTNHKIDSLEEKFDALDRRS
jgi:tetrahydromethanopterin S-methyltransferase subunit G